MRVIPLVLVTCSAFAQSGSDAGPLLRDVAASFRNLTSYRVEGRISSDLDLGFRMKDDHTFRISARPPQMHIEISGGPEWATGVPFVAICSGLNGWLYFAKINKYEKVDPNDLGDRHCTPGTLTGFEHVADDLRSAVITGAGHAQFEGSRQSCVVVEAQYRLIRDLTLTAGMVSKTGRVSRRMCIETSRKLILTDHFEIDTLGPDRYHSEINVTYDRTERNPALADELFEFRPPTGASEIVPPVTANAPPATTNAPPTRGPIPGPNISTMPEPISKEEPAYTQEAWDEGVEGEVILTVEISREGAIRNIKVAQSLGWGLDEKAVECVRKWSFRPATQNGAALSANAGITIAFSLPDKRPELPSSGPVSRPELPPLLPIVELRLPSDLDDFFNAVAMAFEAPEVCERIDETARGGGGSEHGAQIQRLRSECYLDIAQAIRDPKLCDHVTPVRTDTLDGSRLDKAYCLASLSGVTTSVYPRMDAFASFMRKLGYDDPQITISRRTHWPVDTSSRATTSKDYWDFAFNLAVSGRAQDRAEFLKRVMSLQ